MAQWPRGELGESAGRYVSGAEGSQRTTKVMCRMNAIFGALLMSASIACAQTDAAQNVPAVSNLLAEARALIDAGKPREAIEKLQAIDPSLKSDSIEELVGVAYYHA